MNKTQEALKLALEALEEIHPGNMTPMAEDNWSKAITAIREALADHIGDANKMAEQPAQQHEPVAYAVYHRMGGSKTLHWPEQHSEDGDHNEYRLVPLYEHPPAQQQEPVKVEYWLQDTMESGRWVTTDNMARATAEKMLSGEYGDVYPQGRIVEPSPTASKPWVGLTQKDKKEIERLAVYVEGAISLTEAKLKEKNA